LFFVVGWFGTPPLTNPELVLPQLG